MSFDKGVAIILHLLSSIIKEFQRQKKEGAENSAPSSFLGPDETAVAVTSMNGTDLIF
jgi:hypothetical protein